MRRRAPILVAIAIVAVPCLLWELTRIHEPRYQGKSLTGWIQQYNRFGPAATGRPSDPEKWMQASHALDVIGTNAIPFAMPLASTHDSPVKRLLLKIPMPLHVLDKFGCKDAYIHWTIQKTDHVLVLRAIGDLDHFGSSAISNALSFKDSPDVKVRVAAGDALGRIAAKNRVSVARN